MAGNATLAARKVVEELFSPGRGKPGRAMPDHETTPAREAIPVVESLPRLRLRRGSPPRRHRRALNKRRPIPNLGQHNRVALPIPTTDKRCPEPAECRRQTVGTAEASSRVAIAAA
jgi:hypothetical protein